eukprot:Phypoly_transcript_02524.p2 GENE.Phypoly_transcript_02524~~Phypoly_transcript_02524.p2  ORF type:complete len:388 (-),score=90.65 Phypoly_transcript_02524:1617-2738(-)
MEEDNPFGDLDEADYNSYECNLAPAASLDADKYKFVEYHKIDLGRRGKHNVSKEESSKNEWIVLEKVHGANFSFYCNGKTIACSRRNALLDDNETFFDFQKVRDRYRDNIFELFNKLQTKLGGNVDYIALYGELFGGFYPHPTIPDLGFCPVQKQIYYSDKIDFYAFDVRVHEKGDVEKQYWLDYKLAMSLFKECGFFYAQPLLVGTLEECLAFNYAITTTIPAKYNLPPLPKNQCEGVVVKSMAPVITKKGRVIFKLKNPNFDEVNPKHESLYDKQKAQREEALTTVYEDIERYINHNRVISLRSKIGPFGKDKLETVAQLLLDDVIADFSRDSPDTWGLVTNQYERILQNTKSKISTFVLEWLSFNEKNMT